MIKDNPTIGLYGIDGVYNYGCEAIVRGTEIILREMWPNITIKYASLRPEDDKKRLKECNVKIIPRKVYPIFTPHRLNGILAYNTGKYFENLYREDLRWIKDCDAIFSIGGDMYTLPPDYTASKLSYYHPLIHFGNLVKKKEKKLIIWGASIGPFNGKAKNVFNEHFKKVDLITSREPKTTDYLKNLGISQNVEKCADPVFAISSNLDIKEKNSICIGINFSPLSSFYTHGKNYNTIISNQAKIIADIIKKFDAEIILIPHVVCDFNIMDDDLRYLKEIKQLLPNDIKNKVNLIDQDPGFLGIKKILYSCDIVIAARMHCAINALEAGVPTILISYSQKAEGMVKYIYGNNDWIISLNDLNSNNLIEMVKIMLLKHDSLSKFLYKNKKKVNSEAYSPLNKLNKILN